METTTEESKLSWIRKTWKEIMVLGVFPTTIHDESGRHPGAIHGKKIQQRHGHKTGKSHAALLSNHERVVADRAMRMGISLAEYARRYWQG